jgi:hypothetical protein
MKTALDALIEELEAGTWGPAHGPTRRFAQRAERTPDTPATPLPRSHKPGTEVACGSPHCAGCYELESGVRIHPPKSGPEWREWLLKWEPKGNVQ